MSALRPTHFVIAGAGYAGLSCALKLGHYAKKFGQNAFKVSLINPEPRQELGDNLSHSLETGRGDFFNFLPLLKRLDIHFTEGTLGEIDTKNHKALVRGQRRSTIQYDQLILATGLRPKIPEVAGLSEFLKTDEDPFRRIYTIRHNRDVQSLRLSLRRMRWSDSPQESAEKDNFVVILGAGALGLEIAGELASLRGRNKRKRIILVDKKHELLGNFSPIARRVLKADLQSLQIESVLGSPAIKIDDEKMYIKNGQIIPWNLLILCAGSTLQRPLYEVFTASNTANDGLLVRDDFSIVGFANHYAIGSLAQGIEGSPSEQGSFLGESLGRYFIKGDKKIAPFKASFQTKLVSLGPFRGLGNLGKVNKENKAATVFSPFIAGPIVHQMKKLARLSYVTRLRFPIF